MVITEIRHLYGRCTCSVLTDHSKHRDYNQRAGLLVSLDSQLPPGLAKTAVNIFVTAQWEDVAAMAVHSTPSQTAPLFVGWKVSTWYQRAVFTNKALPRSTWQPDIKCLQPAIQKLVWVLLGPTQLVHQMWTSCVLAPFWKLLTMPTWHSRVNARH